MNIIRSNYNMTIEDKGLHAPRPCEKVASFNDLAQVSERSMKMMAFKGTFVHIT